MEWLDTLVFETSAVRREGSNPSFPAKDIMQVKLTNYRMDSENPTIRMRVCPSNGATSIGIVVDIEPLDAEDSGWSARYYREITVMWATGKRRGTHSKHPACNLVDFDKYMNRIKEESDKLEKLSQEANSFGT